MFGMNDPNAPYAIPTYDDPYAEQYDPATTGLLGERARRSAAGTLKEGTGGFHPGAAIKGVGRQFDRGVTQKLGGGAKNLATNPKDWLGNVGQDWQNLVKSDLGWAVPFAWPEKIGAMAGMWGEGGMLSPAGGGLPMGGMGAAAGGLGAMTVNQFGQQGQQQPYGQQTQGAGTLGAGAGNVARHFDTPQQRQPYFLGSGGLGRLG